MTKTNVKANPSTTHRHDTPNNKTHIIKFRVTAEEKASLELTCKLLNLSLSTFIRRAIHNVKIEKTVIVAGGGEEPLTAFRLSAEKVLGELYGNAQAYRLSRKGNCIVQP